MFAHVVGAGFHIRLSEVCVKGMTELAQRNNSTFLVIWIYGIIAPMMLQLMLGETLKKGPMAPFSNPPISVKNLGRETIVRGFSEVT